MVWFGRSAVVTQRNGQLFLLFRVGNVRSSHLLEAHVRAQLIQKVVTEEGENIFFHQQELKVSCYSLRRMMITTPYVDRLVPRWMEGKTEPFCCGRSLWATCKYKPSTRSDLSRSLHPGLTRTVLSGSCHRKIS